MRGCIAMSSLLRFFVLFHLGFSTLYAEGGGSETSQSNFDVCLVKDTNSSEASDTSGNDQTRENIENTELTRLGLLLDTACSKIKGEAKTQWDILTQMFPNWRAQFLEVGIGSIPEFWFFDEVQKINAGDPTSKLFLRDGSKIVSNPMKTALNISVGQSKYKFDESRTVSQVAKTLTKFLIIAKADKLDLLSEVKASTIGKMANYPGDVLAQYLVLFGKLRQDAKNQGTDVTIDSEDFEGYTGFLNFIVKTDLSTHKNVLITAIAQVIPKNANSDFLGSMWGKYGVDALIQNGILFHYASEFFQSLGVWKAPYNSKISYWANLGELKGTEAPSRLRGLFSTAAFTSYSAIFLTKLVGAYSFVPVSRIIMENIKRVPKAHNIHITILLTGLRLGAPLKYVAAKYPKAKFPLIAASGIAALSWGDMLQKQYGLEQTAVGAGTLAAAYLATKNFGLTQTAAGAAVLSAAYTLWNEKLTNTAVALTAASLAWYKLRANQPAQ